MTPVPSIKGSAVTRLIEDVAKLLSSGALSRAEAGRWLVPEDFALLEREVVISSWYDVRCYARLSQLLLDVEGHGDPEYLRLRGRHTAQRLLESGLYSQFEYLQRIGTSRPRDPDAAVAAFGRDLRMLTTMSGSMFNFTRWTSRPDPEFARRHRLEVSEARDFPEVLCWSTDGFVNQMAAQHRGSPDLWTWKREAADRIVFRMTADL